MRLQVFLSHNGVCSRRDAMAVIQSGRVRVNGQTVREPSTPVDGTEAITVDGSAVGVKTYAYVMMHKPAGYTTTKDDPHAEKTVMELLPPQLRHVSPVGRLDRDTEGLLLFTNDGSWAQRLTHPKFHLDKTYHARVSGRLTSEEKKVLEAGIMLEGRKTAPCRITDVRYNGKDTDVTITIHEGRKRQVRAMFYTVGHRVLHLKRTAMGTLTLGPLKLGEWRALTMQEIRDLGKFSKSP